jgi:hypothetical protein
MTYVAPSVTKNFHTVTHQSQSFFESTYRHTTHKLYKTVKVIPSLFHTEFHMTVPPRITTWANLSGRPDLDSLYAALGHDHSTQYAALSHHHDDRFYQKAEVDTMVANAGTGDLSNYYDAGQVDTLLLGKAPAIHQHTQYVTDTALNTLLAQKVDYNSMSAYVSGGFEQIDSNILRFHSISQDIYSEDILKILFYADGSDQIIDLPSMAYVSTTLLGLLGTLNGMQTTIGQLESRVATLEGNQVGPGGP